MESCLSLFALLSHQFGRSPHNHWPPHVFFGAAFSVRCSIWGLQLQSATVYYTRVVARWVERPTIGEPHRASLQEPMKSPEAPAPRSCLGAAPQRKRNCRSHGATTKPSRPGVTPADSLVWRLAAQAKSLAKMLQNEGGRSASEDETLFPTQLMALFPTLGYH